MPITCVQYPSYAQKKKLFGKFVDSDPINLIFGSTQLNEIENFLGARSWGDVGAADDLYVKKKKQDLQLSNGPIWERFHVRFWNMVDSIIASAHYETLGLTGHNVHHFEGGEVKVLNAFNSAVSAKNWLVERGAVLIPDTEELKRFNDGYATRIRKRPGKIDGS